MAPHVHMPKRMNTKALLPVLAALLLSACAAEPEAIDGEASGAAATTKKEFERAVEIVKGLDYLPFEHKQDGCYARAFYMSMELAADEIESNSVYAFAKGRSADARLRVGSTTWGYHVAPMIKVRSTGDNSVPRVLDPSVNAEPMTTEAWLTKMGHARGEAAETKPTVFFVQGSDYSPHTAAKHPRSRDVPDFDDLEPFNVSAIQHACGVMHEFLGCNGTDDAATAKRKREKLVTRTRDLVDTLRGLGKLNPDARFSMETCRNAEIVKCETAK
jgi:hypothetical protein